MSQYIVEDIFKDINPDDLMDDSDDNYEEDYSDGVSRNPDKNGVYEYGIQFTVYDYKTKVNIPDLIAYLIEMFENHSGNVDTYSDIMVLNTRDSDIVNPAFETGTVDPEYVWSEDDDEGATVIFRFNRRNKRRCIHSLMNMLKSYIIKRCGVAENNIRFYLYISDRKNIYGIVKYLSPVDSYIIGAGRINYILTKDGVDDTSVFRYTVGQAYDAEIDDRRFQIINTGIDFRVMYMDERHNIHQRSFPGEYKKPTTDYIAKDCGKCMYLCGSNRHYNPNEERSYLIDRTLNIVVPDFRYICYGKSHLIFYNNSEDIVAVIDKDCGHFLENDEYDVERRNSYTYIYYESCDEVDKFMSITR